MGISFGIRTHVKEGQPGRRYDVRRKKIAASSMGEG